MGLFDSFRRDRKTHHETEQEEPVAASGQEVDSEEEGAVQVEPLNAEDQESFEPVVEISSDNAEEAVPGQIEDDHVEVDESVSDADSDGFPDVPMKSLKTMSEKKRVDHAIGTTQIMAIINQKGGVGKSTTAVNLSASLGVCDKAVLLVDLDPQGNATSGLGVDKSQINQDVYDVLLSEVPVEDAIIPDICEGVDILPATINLAGAEVELVNEMARENRLKAAIGGLRGKYDYIFIDCPPSLGLLTVNALVASDKLLIPIQCEFYALEGVTKLLDSMKRVKSMLNPSLDIFGVVLTMYDGRTTLSRQVAQEVRRYFGKLVFETKIPRTVKLSEAPSYGMPITEYDPTGKGGESYLAMAKEVIDRG